MDSRRKGQADERQQNPDDGHELLRPVHARLRVRGRIENAKRQARDAAPKTSHSPERQPLQGRKACAAADEADAGEGARPCGGHIARMQPG